MDGTDEAVAALGGIRADLEQPDVFDDAEMGA